MVLDILMCPDLYLSSSFGILLCSRYKTGSHLQTFSNQHFFSWSVKRQVLVDQHMSFQVPFPLLPFSKAPFL